MFERLFKKHKYKQDVKEKLALEEQEQHEQRLYKQAKEKLKSEHHETQIFSRSQLVASKINQKRYNKVAECINKILKAIDMSKGGFTLALEGDYVLNVYEAVELTESIKKSGYKCYLSFYEGNKPHAITVFKFRLMNGE